MGRPSALTEAKWEIIGKRLLSGESAASLAREFKVSKATISTRFSKRVQNVKEVAHQIVETERALSLLNIPEQMAARSLADDLKSISEHLAGAARYGAMTAHHLSGAAHRHNVSIRHDRPLNKDETEKLRSAAILTAMANEASKVGLSLLSANKDSMEEMRRHEYERNNSPMNADQRQARIAELYAKTTPKIAEK